jgi:hypothetical protein
MHLYQSHVVFRSFCDLYSEDKRQEEIKEASLRSSTNSSRASSFSEQGGFAPSLAMSNYALSRNSTKVSLDPPSLYISRVDAYSSPPSLQSSSSSTSSSSEYYPAALYTGHIAKREADTVTLDDEATSASQDLSLRRF